MLHSQRQTFLDSARQQPEFAAFDGIKAEAGILDSAFAVSESGVILGDAAFTGPAGAVFCLRQALELHALLRAGVPAGRAAPAAARAASQFMQADHQAVPGWVAIMAADIAPKAEVLARLFPAANVEDVQIVRQNWAWLGTAEGLMETGGDIRLQRDPRSALNGYGCSHRPRPWAVTFASSTASSSSERGYRAADEWRLRVTAEMLRHGRRGAVARALADARAGIAAVYGLAEGTAVVLAASGTDTELLALALTHLAPGDAPIVNMLVAPAETGRGVPMAASGKHFAVDTARGADVTFEAPIAGFRPDTEVANILLRYKDGGLRARAEVEAELDSVLAAGIAAGKKVILHALDLSKTGLLAPAPAFLAGLRAKYGQDFDIVVDACQARLSAASVRMYLALDAVVLVTGSKFFTGPPFAGAALIPPRIAARLNHGVLPEGLDAYFGRDDFCPCAAAKRLPDAGNYGLALRWQAALAEMRALMAVPAVTRARILRDFAAVVAWKIAENPALALLARPALARGAEAEDWELQRSIFSFSLRAPHAPERCLTPVEARAVYLWLNADLSALLADEAVAARICHIGQPVTLPQAGGDGTQGVLRVSAGARLISGEPSHKGLGEDVRLRRELDDLAAVFDKIGLVLRHWERLWAANPAPRYRPASVKRLTGEGVGSPLT